MGGTLTWLGDSDPTATDVTTHGMTFVKGEAVAVKDKDVFERLSKNPMFSSEKDAKPVDAVEPAPVDVEEGTEKGAIKDRLRALGISVQGNPSLETLRGKLADATK